ncbi:hypothetical protein [Chenggangzhangella methanolivorans]|uniref:hypothetical protein n=1 Tax=Chenggangzhangella methanolivorans TaxID=1437009 RepID=UPI0021BD1470|nr:hypothetical protein [Chenggangzhangella methanolivorans]
MIESDGAAIGVGWAATIGSFVILGLFAGVVTAGLQYFGGPLLSFRLLIHRPRLAACGPRRTSV